MKKLFLCVGAAKTGTTWLYRAIGRNPDLWFTPEKELHYHFSVHGRFDRLTPEIRRRKLAEAVEWAEGPGRDDRGRDSRLDWYRRFAAGPVSDDWYRGLFTGAPEGAWASDFSPSTSLIPDAGWKAVAKFAPETRIVYILREPRERLWSHAKFHAAHMGRFEEFEKMSLAEMESLIKRFRLAEDGDYGAHLRRIYAHAPRENVLLIQYDMIARNPRGVLREVEAHLGLRPTPVEAESFVERVNASERMTPPEGFGDIHHRRFAREMKSLVDQGVGFAQPWAESYMGKPFGWRRQLVRMLGR